MKKTKKSSATVERNNEESKNQSATPEIAQD